MTHTAQQQGLKNKIKYPYKEDSLAESVYSELLKGSTENKTYGDLVDSILQQVIEWVEERRDEIGEERDWYEKNIILNRIISQLKGELS